MSEALRFANDTLSLDAALLHDQLCDEFENQLQEGQVPRIEDMLARVPERERRALFDALFRIEIQSQPDPFSRRDEYRARFSKFAEQVDAILCEPFSQIAALPSNAAPVTIDDDELPMPRSIGRYRVDEILGRGGFGVVYLALDELLNRHVAIKVPHRKHVAKIEDAAPYLTEAQILARFHHPNIVPVYDFGSTENVLCYLVSMYVKGGTLADRMAGGPLPVTEAARLAAVIADTLHFAHGKGLVHRDIKPSNILLDPDGTPYVADFGLALREENFGRGPRYAGTPAYMSPEQARGEGHRVNGCSDIFSLGVVLYEMLTGRKPFHGETKEELLEQVAHVEPAPPRQIVHVDFPKELERICLKALAKRTSERYTTAKDLADDLRHFLNQLNDSKLLAPTPAITLPQPPAPIGAATTAVPTPMPTSGAEPPVRVMPKGLRSFDAGDREFFLELLPGPRDRNGLPESIRFWKRRIEEMDPDNTFSVGLIYGPSGCGKSSLVKAGLLPRLSENVIAIYVEAGGAETETRLLNSLRKRCPALAGETDLVKTFAALRKGRGIAAGKKVLIVLDQFEQWLHANKDAENPPLVQALRHCDGAHVQCIVMVRDDFWLAISRFMRDLEIDLVPDKNIAVVDLFDLKHAEKVLSAFGRAYGKLPEGAGEKSKEQREFLKQAVAGLAQDNKVICVRLALFADMFEQRDWTPAALKQVGGAQGVGLAFLDETFSSRSANPKHHLHEKAIPAVLKALLPEAGEDIKGHMRSRDDLLREVLLKDSSYANHPKDFAELIQILDSETRLITPTDPEGIDQGDAAQLNRDAQSPEASAPASGKYYQLTHDYLVQPLRDWLTREQNKYRKGRAESKLAERARLWNAKPQTHHLPTVDEWAKIRLYTRGKDWTPPQRKMMRSADRHYLAWCVGLLACLFILGWVGWEYSARMNAWKLHDNLLGVDVANIRPVLAEIGPYRDRVEPLLQRSLIRTEASLRQEPNSAIEAKNRLKLSLALVHTHPEHLDYLREQLLHAEPNEFAAIRDVLNEFKSVLAEPLWREMTSKDCSAGKRFRAACSLAEYLNSEDARRMECAAIVVRDLQAEDPMALFHWKDALKTVQSDLLPALAVSLEDTKWSDRERLFLIEFYRIYAEGDKNALKPLGDRFNLKRKYPDSAEQAKRKAAVGAALVSLGQPDDVWPFLVHNDNPTIRSFLIERLSRSGVSVETLMNRLENESNTSARRALILIIGSTSLVDRPRITDRLFKLFETDRDAGVHGALRWALRENSFAAQLENIERKLASNDPDKDRSWYVNRQLQTFTVIQIPWRLPYCPQKPLKIPPHQFGIMATEVTEQQFQLFWRERHSDPRRAARPDLPASDVDWYIAAEFCNWLSEKENIRPDQWCYELRDGKYGYSKDYFWKHGYRLPTEVEWEFACRAGARAPWCCGEVDDELAGKYSCWLGNSSRRGIAQCGPVMSFKPNDWGLFDMHGNVTEWCQQSTLAPLSDVNPEFVECSGRGGSYLSAYQAAAADSNLRLFRNMSKPFIGLRLVRTLAERQSKCVN